MAIALALLSLISGTSKSVSVCGINAASVARPRAGASLLAIAAYFLGLIVGAALLVFVLTLSGVMIVTALGIDPEGRRLAASVVAIVVGVAEAIHGAWLFPHIAWAVPRKWAAIIPTTAFLLGPRSRDFGRI